MKEPFTLRAPPDLHIDYARELNDQQYQAVTAAPGPALVIAGAGSGKTRTLTYRVAYLAEHGVHPERILLLTFTNKAAAEMMRRAADLVGQQMSAVWGGTFHSIGYRLLRRHPEAVGYQRDFTILDREDADRLLKEVLTEAELGTSNFHLPKLEVVAEILSLAVNTRRTLSDVASESTSHGVELGPALEQLGQLYQQRKRQANVMDFDDLLGQWLKLFHDQADVCQRYQEQFQFILVDEYQDINPIQCELIDLLAQRHGNLMVVGDDAQSIYSWRGADYHNILEFPERWPQTSLYKIETNYRSTPEILAVANAAIAANVHQFPKQLAPVRPAGMKPVLVTCQSGQQQAAFVAQRVLHLCEGGVGLAKMAVLYRSHFHAMELQMELTRQQIPYQITSGVRFFEQAHIKDVTAFLKLVGNPRDEVAFKRLVRMLPGIGPKGAARLWRLFQVEPAAAERPVPGGASSTDPLGPHHISAAGTPGLPAAESGRSVEAHPANPEGLAGRLRACVAALPKKAQAQWPQFVETLLQLAQAELQSQPSRMIQLVLEAGYADYLQETYQKARARLEDLDQLAEFARSFPNLHEFLNQLALLANLDAEGAGVDEKGQEKLWLSTIHQAKGLEFDVVFIIMLCEDLFPSARAQDDPEREEEERRLFYVAITRARDELYLSHPLARSVGGPSAARFYEASRFLEEIAGAGLEVCNLAEVPSPAKGW